MASISARGGLLVAAATAAALLAPAVSGAIVARDCARPGAACTIAETARRAGVHFGAIASTGQSDAERALLAEHFTSVTAENAMKWGEIAPRVGNYGFADADEIAAFAETNGMRLRGHTLAWGVMQMPSDLASTVAAAADPAARMSELLGEHFGTMVGRYGARVAQWDVVNEPLEVAGTVLAKNVFLDALGPGYLGLSFALARALAPGASLYLNEYVLSWPSPKLAALRTLVGNLRAGGVPIDGVGIQGHFYPFFPLPDRATMEQELRAIADLGVEIEITELDVSSWHFRDDPDPLARQAAFFGDVVSACMAVPSCRGITTWGIQDGDSWLDHAPPFDLAAPNDPLLFDRDLEPKPAYAAVRDAIATRAVPFEDEAWGVFRRVGKLRRDGLLRGPSVRTARRVVRRAAQMLRAERFADACDRLARGVRAANEATGPAVAEAAEAITALRLGLRCDEA
ncbi:endo-1,4-beta-xylanase [bacterium]|nr:endo-1,4-beta-xylanase [bacterium]